METFTGKKAESLQLRDFVSLAWTERQQALRFLGWLGEMRALGDGRARR